jgi:SNF2 family DNA or RNA helicase
MEFWQMIDMLGYASKMGGFNNYRNRYNTKDVRLLRELNDRVRSMFFVRRKKKDVLPELPDKMRTIVPLEIDNWPEYSATEDDIAKFFATRKAEDASFRSELEMNLRRLLREDPTIDYDKAYDAGVRARYTNAYEMAEKAERLLRWEALKQMSLKGKMKAIHEWIGDFLENSDQKLVVFASHQEPIHQIAAKYKQKYGAVYIDGSVKVEDRMKIVDRFQNDPACRLIIGNMIAMGEGLTLTAASNVAFIEFGWNPKTHSQAEDRCHRIGQHDSVMVYSLVGRGTIDEEIVALIEEKREIVDAIQDGDDDTRDAFMQQLEARMEAKKQHARRTQNALT